MTPQTLQIVVGAGLFQKDVHDEVAVIEQDPFGVLVAFQADGEFPSLLNLEMDLVRDRLVLAGVGSSTDNKMICEAGYFSQVENYYVQCFLGLRGSYGCKPRRVIDFRGVLRAGIFVEVVR